MWRRWGLIRQFKLQALKFIRLRAAPDEIAKGVALGVFIGMTPTFGFQMAIAVFFAFLLKENKLAAALGVWITNPITAPFIYALEYESGRILLGMSRPSFSVEFNSEMLHLGWELLLPLCLGSLLYGALCAGLSFALTLRLIPSVQSWRIGRWPKPRRHSGDC